jgi:integrase
MPLSDIAARAAKPIAKPYKLSDGEGLHLLVTPRGSKLWRLAYRFGGKQKTLALGSYPAVTLADARSARTDAKRLLANHLDPSHQKQIRQEELKVTFSKVADELFAKMEREGRAPATLVKTRWLLDLATPSLGHRPIADISASDVLRVIHQIEAKGRYETAHRLRSTCGKVFRYAVATDRAERDPTTDLRGALTQRKVTHRAAITEPKKIGRLLRAIDEYQGRGITAYALRLAPLVFVRPGELRQAEWAELDLEKSEWRIAAAKTKMRRPHRVPLSRQAVEIVNALRHRSGDSKWLFPSATSFQRPLSENTLNCALRKLGFESKEMCAHGFRAMAATRLNEMGKWNPDAIERQLAHEEQNAVRRAYTHGTEYWPERVLMMQAWADYLDDLRGRGEVLPFRGVAVR